MSTPYQESKMHTKIRTIVLAALIVVVALVPSCPVVYRAGGAVILGALWELTNEKKAGKPWLR